MIFRCLVLGDLENNCYIFGDHKTREVAIIDAPQDIEKVINSVNGHGDSVKYIVLTHAHFDHTDGLAMLRMAYPYAEVICHSEELSGAGSTSVESDKKVNGGEVLEIGSERLEIIHTPGHTIDGICLYSEENKVLFSGDTLFRATIGRSDLPSGNFEQLVDGIKKRILCLPDDVEVYPGHGNSTTIAWERENNKYLV